MNMHQAKRPVVVEVKRRKLLGLPFAKNDNQPSTADHAVVVALGSAEIVDGAVRQSIVSDGGGARDDGGPKKETDHQKVFRLVGERKFEDAARLAKRLIDAGNIDGFFIYGAAPAFRKATEAFAEHVAVSRRGAFSEIQTIKPEMAQVMLTANENNRNIHVRGLTARLRDIIDGRWELNGQGLIVAKTGQLNDGQHRLWAILLSGVATRFSVFYGATRESRATLDLGEKRPPRDRFRFAGIPNDSRVASIVNLTHHLISGRDATETEKLDVYFADQDRYQFAAQIGNGVPKGSPTASLCAAAYLLSRSGYEDDIIKKFFREAKGVDSSHNKSPSFALLKALIGNRTSTPPITATPLEWIFTTCDLFLKWSAGKKTASIQKSEDLPAGVAL